VCVCTMLYKVSALVHLPRTPPWRFFFLFFIIYGQCPSTFTTQGHRGGFFLKKKCVQRWRLLHPGASRHSQFYFILLVPKMEKPAAWGIQKRDLLTHKRDLLTHKRDLLTHKRDLLTHKRWRSLLPGVQKRDLLTHKRDLLTHKRDLLTHRRWRSLLPGASRHSQKALFNDLT